MSAHFCSLFHHFIINLLISCSCCCYSLIHTIVKSVQEGQSNLCLTLWFSCLSAALSALKGYSSAPVTRESFAEKVSLAHKPDNDRAVTFKFFPGMGEQHRFTVVQFLPCLVAPLRTEKQYCIYIWCLTISQVFHRSYTLRHLTSDTSLKRGPFCLIQYIRS